MVKYKKWTKEEFAQFMEDYFIDLENDNLWKFIKDCENVFMYMDSKNNLVIKVKEHKE